MCPVSGTALAAGVDSVVHRAQVHCHSLSVGFVIPAQAGTQIAAMDSRLRGNDRLHL